MTRNANDFKGLMKNLIKMIWFIVSVFGISCTMLANCLLAAEQISLQATDGFPLKASYERVDSTSSARPAVLLLHMFKNNKESWHPLILALREQGISSLAVDLRGHGESRVDAFGVDQSDKVLGRDAVFFNQIYQDGLGAVAWLQAKGHQKISVVGASVGCSVAMHMMAAAKPKMSAMVLMTPGHDYLGIDTMSHLEKWPGLPLLILTSEEEADRGADAIYKRLKKRGAQLVVFEEESIHGTMMFGEVEGVEERISKWLAEQFKR